MSHDKQETRRGFLRAFGRPSPVVTVRRTDEADQRPPLDSAVEGTSVVERDGSDAAPPLRKYQFTLRSLFILTVVIAVFFAATGRAMLADPWLVAIALGLALVIEALRAACVWGFERFLYWVFGVTPRTKR